MVAFFHFPSNVSSERADVVVAVPVTPQHLSARANVGVQVMRVTRIYRTVSYERQH